VIWEDQKEDGNTQLILDVLKIVLKGQKKRRKSLTTVLTL
jgi:hypothetical protein